MLSLVLHPPFIYLFTCFFLLLKNYNNVAKPAKPEIYDIVPVSKIPTVYDVGETNLEMHHYSKGQQFVQ